MVVDEVLIMDLVVLIALIKLEPFVHVEDLCYFDRVLKLLRFDLDYNRPKGRGLKLLKALAVEASLQRDMLMSSTCNCVGYGTSSEDGLNPRDVAVAIGAPVGLEEGLIVAVLNLHVQCACALAGAVVSRWS